MRDPQLIEPIPQPHPIQVPRLVPISRRHERDEKTIPTLPIDEGKHAHQPKRREPLSTTQIHQSDTIRTRPRHRTLNCRRVTPRTQDQIWHDAPQTEAQNEIRVESGQYGRHRTGCAEYHACSPANTPPRDRRQNRQERPWLLN